MEEILQMVEAILKYDDQMFSLVRKDLEKTVSETLLHGADSLEARRVQINEFKAAGMSQAEAELQIEQIKEALFGLIENLKDSVENVDKKEFLDSLYQSICVYLDETVAEYNAAAPSIQVELCHENAKIPTYAHAGDQGADIYAVEDTIIPPHSYGTMVSTGLKLNIPEGWAIAIRPRSGMSKRTPLRISNCVPTIDTGFRGEIRILFDNFSDEPVSIKAGDRIAQMILERNHRGIFTQVDSVEDDTDRGEGGFGSSGK